MNLKIVILVILTWLITGCSQPLPVDKLDYQGDWRNANVQLIINRDGSVWYKKVIDSKTTSIEAPIKAFIGNNFEVGVGWFTTVFEVSEPPRLSDGLWKMTVDGHILIKQ